MVGNQAQRSPRRLAELQGVLTRYGLHVPDLRITPLGGAGGFSGARFWRLEGTQHPYCLRRWPAEHPDPERLSFIHRVLRHVASHGCPKVAVPLAARDGSTFVRCGGHLWELTHWLPGRADYWQNPSIGKLHSAASTLAQFHLAAASFPAAAAETAPSAALAQRCQQIQRLRQHEQRLLEQRLRANHRWPELVPLGEELLALFRTTCGPVERLLQQTATVAVPRQPCIRDVWHENVLFTGDKVTGLVDFGSLNYETVVGDLTRLLGSFARDDAERWREGITAYEQVRPLRQEERELLKAFDQSGVLLAGLNWLRWILLEEREFEDRQAVLSRVDQNLGRLRRLAGTNRHE